MNEPQRFRDRAEAGQRLAERLRELPIERGIVLALPRGGVLVGYEIARILQLPLDVILTRKIGAPFNPEYAIGVVAENGFVSVNRQELELGIATPDYIARAVRELSAELMRRRQRYRGGRPLPDLTGRTAIIVDDGVATGFTMLGAIAAVKEQHPARLIAALPVAPPQAVEQLAPQVDDLVVLLTPDPLDGVGAWYEDFRQLDDDEVVALLQRAQQELAQAP
ncbi:phosphoribosyltransferase [Thermorudis peleae]|uniref:phosphoribosyltransferase n=1 Tax=Thermorudis peleae TaxID=1382356 RepID=UPI00056F2FC9|nr:phosphoribosyltransferase family protein [Thermorudis peleae]